MILAIDTSTKMATAALAANRTIMAEFSVYSDKTHSKALLPMIDTMFKSTGSLPEAIELIVCVNGPGSFTGLRIGAAVAKSFAYALSKPIAEVSSLDVLAYSALTKTHTICSMIDARNGHVYCAFYSWQEDDTIKEHAGVLDDYGSFVRLTDYMTLPVSEAVSIGKSFLRPLYFIGNGADCYRDLLNLDSAQIAVSYLNMHRAGILGIYAAQNKDNLKIVDSGAFAPVYFRRQERD